MPQLILRQFVLGYLLLLGCSHILHAQNYDPKAKEYTIRGQQDLLEHQYERAYKQFDRALDFAPTYTPAMHGMAAANELLGRFAEAVGWYDRVLVKDPRYSRILFFEAGRVHFNVGNYQKALDLFYEFLALQELPPTEFGLLGETELAVEQTYLAEVHQMMNACRLASDLDQFKTIRSIQNIGPTINTEADEYFPYLTNDQNLLFYTRRADRFSDEDLFYSSSIDMGWQTGQSVSSNFNSPKNEGMSTLIQNGKKMFFTACNRKAVKGPCDIWEATLDGHALRQIHELPGDLNSDSWESQASISCDGTTLFFSSNRPGGEGGTDIWVSTLDENGLWSEPLNLGNNVNTTADEEAPFITNDGETLYFSSTGHTCLGEQDIFMSRKGEDGKWSKPVNLGPPVNSSYRELGFFLSADGRKGYFASDRDGGQGGMDIYQFELPQELIARPITFV
ncbi:MAG: PD40 domain-containing protein, partial [Phaeodactylibacter sp.]|nr:PD40 domain-containing protein [Phaeodactylibacter sp.]